MQKSYIVKTSKSTPINKGKEKKIEKLFVQYNKYAKEVAKLQWELFFLPQEFHKSSHKELKTLIDSSKNFDEFRKSTIKKIPNISEKKFVKSKVIPISLIDEYIKSKDKNQLSKLSQRYKREVIIQVTSTLESYLSNMKNEFKRKVYKLKNLQKQERIDLNYINKYNLWYSNSAITYNIKNPKTKESIPETIPYETVLKARYIFKNLMKKWRRPKFHGSIKSMTLGMDVVKITKDGDKGKKNTTTNTLWANLSSLVARDIINIPFNLTYHKFFQSNRNEPINYIQITKKFTKKRGYHYQYVLLKNYEPLVETSQKQEKFPQKTEYRKKYVDMDDKVIGIDLGLRILFTTSSNNNQYYGKDIINYLYKKDKEIVRLFKEKQKHRLPLNKSTKYREAVRKLKEFLKNYINSEINKMIKREKLGIGSRIVLEDLNFKSPKLSKRLNRILQNFGKSIIKQKLEMVSYDFNGGIEIEYVSAAYTSKECNVCGYVSNYNRKSQSEFCCEMCNMEENFRRIKEKDKKLTLTEFLKGITYETSLKENSTNIKYFYNGKKLNMKLIKINADSNAAKTIKGRSSVFNKRKKAYEVINLYDSRAIVLEKIISNFRKKSTESQYSMALHLGSQYKKIYIEHSKVPFSA